MWRPPQFICFTLIHWETLYLVSLVECNQKLKSCSLPVTIVVLYLPLYGVLSKTLHTAQAHFAVRHASVKHKNKLTENAKITLYPRGPCERKENKRNPQFPFCHPAFNGRSFEEDQGNNTVCLSVWPLSYLSNTSTDYGRNTKMRGDQVCRLSWEFSRRLIPAVEVSNLQSERFRSEFESPSLRPPRSVRCCFCSLTEKCFPCPARSRRGGAEDQEAQKAQLTLPPWRRGGCASLGEQAMDWREEAPV